MTPQQTEKADVVLQHAQRYQAGRLTIFLGAAPGVGKTYAMLVRAHELHRQGVDVVVGYVETHARHDTEQLLAGLTVLPRICLGDQRRQLQDMDLDAVLARKPTVVLVDEFAHQNISGSRHQKRWQDINELLDAGIDVFTTMNIQHLESLNDVVYQITGIRVQETVPDRVFERIRDIRLIDLPVNELLERLNQGKVYVPEQAQQALNGFFKTANLSALRELAIQTVASHVDHNVRESFVLQGKAPIPLHQHMLVLLDQHSDAEALLRAACRIAESRIAIWTVVAFSHQATALTQNSFQLARQLGAMTEVLYGQQHVQLVYDYAIQHGISTLIMAQPVKTGLCRYWQQDTLSELLKLQPRFEVSLVTVAVKPVPLPVRHLSSVMLSLQETGLLLLVTAFSIVFASLGEQFLAIREISVIFITAVVFIASKTRMTVAVIAAILLFLAYDFLFIPPKFTFQIAAYTGVMTIVAFLAAALIASRLASRLREQVNALTAANRDQSILRDLTEKLSRAVHLQQVLEIADACLTQHLSAQVWLHVPQQSNIGQTLSEKEQISAEWTLKNQQPSGRFTQTLSQSVWWFLPCLASKQCVGVVGLQFSAEQHTLAEQQKRLSEAMVEHIAQAISRTLLSQELEAAKINTETEKLRSALLSSVSHDLRSPLAAMIGAADTLTHYRHAMNPQDQADLLGAIRVEGERLDRYIQNLLDMTRLGHDGLTLKRDWIGVDELVGSAVRRLKRYLPQVRIEVDLPEPAPSLWVHAALIEQAIFNVLENATKFSPENQAVELKVQCLPNQQIQIAIYDQGQGIPEAERERIFDMFYTMQRGDRGQQGTGLGLSIVKAIIGAHMGQIWATAGHHQQGTCIIMSLPIAPAD